jgi:hypothetical protein
MRCLAFTGQRRPTRTRALRTLWTGAVLTALVLPTVSFAQTVVGTIDVGIPGLQVQVTDQLDNQLNDTITLQAVNNTSGTYNCKGHIGFFQLSTGDISGISPVDGTVTVPPGGPYVIVTANNPAGSGVGNTLAYDSASCAAVSSGAGAGGGGDSGTGSVLLEGHFGYNIDFSTQQVVLTADKVDNTGNSSTGTLRLELWALAAPYSGGTVTGTRMASVDVPCGSQGTLPAHTSCTSLSLPTTFTAPSPGTYYVAMFLTEDLSSCNGFCMVDWGNFNQTLVIQPDGTASGGGIQLVGIASILPNFTNNTIQLTVPEVLNSTSGTTGTLRLEIWLLSSPYSRGTVQNGYRIAMTPLPQGCPSALSPGASCSNIGFNALPMSNLPAAGSYDATLFVTQYDSQNCTASDHYCIATAINFNNPVSVPAASPPPSATGGSSSGPTGGGGGSNSGGGGGGGALDAASLTLLGLLTLGIACARVLARGRARARSPSTGRELLAPANRGAPVTIPTTRGLS